MGLKVFKKPSTPIFYFAYKRKKVWKRLNIFGAVFLASIFKEKNLALNLDT